MNSPPPVQVEVEVADDEDMDDDSADMLPADKFTLPARADEVVEAWRAKWAQGALATTDFQDHWRVTVPRIYSPQPNRTCLDYSYNEDLGNALLIAPLEQFVLGGSAVPSARSALCGRVFKQGEPVYSCRECGMDKTCVLCVECFKVSAHRQHKYKICHSGGGGCCDCGDTEAWKRDPFCETHAAIKEEAGQGDAAHGADVLERMKVVASVCLAYCFRLLTLDHAPGLPNELKLKDAERDPLQILDQPDCYCTVLYNDETHTFDQVIATLTRLMKYNHRDSVELVSLIDREGRALVKCTTFQVCDKVKSEIEMFTSRYGPILKVLVLHAYLLAHQNFAMKLLTWLQNFVAKEPALRLVVSRVALGDEWSPGEAAPPGGSGGGVAAGVMQNDCRMWKAARTAWHRLLIATTLMDYETKKTMAVLFTKNYGSILKDFIRDDHDHSFSVSSLSVQLYTTPTLAHHLVARHDALFLLLNTFVSECSRRCNAKGRLEFDRNQVSMSFRRAQFVLYDLKYLLISVPTEFDEDLRKGFLHGMTLMLNLLAMMQGTDSVVRQIGQHQEYEPEWEGAFNLHVKLAHAVTLALEWCAADRALAAALYRMTLRRLHDTERAEPTRVVELCGHTAAVIPYDVSTEPVSIHRPLSRFLAGLHLLLHAHGLDAAELRAAGRPAPPPHELVEPILRTMTMIAQVQAGMWRRNGFSLLSQLYYYHNVKCRAEMLDRDVAMLQIGASLMESNEFLIHVLNKYNLLDWAQPDFESKPIEDDQLRHTISMVEEFLALLIAVVGSRYTPGVGQVTAEDRTQKEIIQMLCIKPMAHSELDRSLPEDQLHETGLESVISEVADFVKPAGGNHRGMYTLKPHLYEQYDTFYYHYTREELSKSEEAQRTRRKAAGLPECCPPPPLPALAPPFRLLAALLSSDVAVHALRTVLERALDLRARSFSENQVHKALHLIGYALRDDESGHYEFSAFAERAARAGLAELVRRLAGSARVDAHRALALWLCGKFKTLLSKNEGTSEENMETDQQEKPNAADADAEKAARAALAAKRRAKLMEQMQAAQKNFITNNSTLFAETDTKVTEEEAQQEMRGLYCGAALGVWGGGVPEPSRVCIMCQEEARVDITTDPLVLVAFVQFSTVLNLRRSGSNGVLPAHWDAPHLPAGRGAAPHVSSCGHALHANCWRKYVDNVVDRENRRPYRLRQPPIFDIEKREYLCPLCERLCNTALPLLPGAPPPPSPPPPLSAALLRSSLHCILTHQVCSEVVHHCTESCEEMHCTARARSVGAASDMDTADTESVTDDAPQYLCTHSRALLPPEFLAHFDTAALPYNERIRELLTDFTSTLVSVCDEPEAGRLSPVAALYRAASYTVLATETVLQAERRPLLGDLPARHQITLQALIRLTAAVPSVWPEPKDLAHQALSALNTLERASPLAHTPFSTLVAAVLAVPALFASAAGPARPAHLARQLTLEAFRADLTRAMLVTDLSGCASRSMDEGEPPRPELGDLLGLIRQLRRGALPEDLDAAEVWGRVKRQCHRFLRCCCLFFHFLSDIIPPEELTVHDQDTWDSMCGYLNMPATFKELLDTPLALTMALEWGSLSNDWFEGEIPAAHVLEPPQPPQLVALPEDFSELMNLVSEFSCPNSEREDSRYPTMCLICGQILCSQSYCCQIEIKKPGRSNATEHVGATVAHALRCGAGAGVFVRARECEALLLVAPARGAALPAPYLDSYGETDQGLRRGNPLRLCPERYAALRSMWLSHGLQEKIARFLDSSIVTTRWQNM